MPPGFCPVIRSAPGKSSGHCRTGVAPVSDPNSGAYRIANCGSSTFAVGRKISSQLLHDGGHASGALMNRAPTPSLSRGERETRSPRLVKEPAAGLAKGACAVRDGNETPSFSLGEKVRMRGMRRTNLSRARILWTVGTTVLPIGNVEEPDLGAERRRPGPLEVECTAAAW